MSKIPVVIASVLKPVDEPRMFDRMGVSLAQTNIYQVNIIGFKPKSLPESSDINFHPLFSFKRLGLKRLFAPFKFFMKVKNIRPKILIIGTHELLTAGIIYKIFYPVKLIYDLRENYSLNIQYGKGFNVIFRNLIAMYVRLKESISKIFIDHYLLAEESYKEIFHIPASRVDLIRNKFSRPADEKLERFTSTQSLKIIYTGTIGEDYGIFEGIEFCKNLKVKRPELTFSIYGFCSNQKEFQKLKQTTKNLEWITIKGGDTPCPHTEILEGIKTHDFGLLPYRNLDYITSCFPSKIYEYLAYELPMIMSDQSSWVEYCNKYQGCIPLNFQNYNVEDAELLLHNKFYTTKPGNEIYWKSEENAFLSAISKF